MGSHGHVSHVEGSHRDDARRHLRTRMAAIAFAVAVLTAFGATACQPRPPAKDRPIIFVHGWSALGAGVNCDGNFGSMQDALRADGFTGAMITIGYYDNDRNCDVHLRDWGSVSDSTVWKDLSKALSAYVYETFTSQGIAVDVVGHSMGGNIVRGAVQGAQAGEPGFSAPLLVEDGVSLGSPYAGAAWYSNLCFWGQCSQLKPGARDIEWLATNPNPQGVGGTDWTAFASSDDDVVPVGSALSITVPDERKITYGDVEHGDYMSNGTAQVRAAEALAAPNR
jgi:pimeloyl-ACP methyl ester carboxylesterase